MINLDRIKVAARWWKSEILQSFLVGKEADNLKGPVVRKRNVIIKLDGCI
jgi:hypothetical protein